METWTLEREKIHLENTKDKLKLALMREQCVLDEERKELLRRRRTSWEEGAHNPIDFDDIVEMNAYDEKERESFGHYVRVDRTVRQLKYLLGSPYFGRIDFREEGTGESEPIYIGRYGFFDKQTYEGLIYDWRTPIASMFYDYGVGKASYFPPAGEIRGEITCKRQYSIEEGMLEYCYDTNVAVQDEMLGRVLAENTDKVLRVIIDTITGEQNLAIRQPESVDLLVMGPAGSGKTSVGMHRLAYLMYHNRDNMDAGRIVVLSRNRIFASYISGILPELGEENVGEVMFDNQLLQRIPGRYRVESFYEQLEFLLSSGEESLRMRSVALKYSQGFLEFLNQKARYGQLTCKDFEGAVELYLSLFSVYAETEDVSARDVYEYTVACIERERILYEDFLGISYVRILSREIRPQEQICHVLVDEAQDYCRAQLYILKSLYPKSRFTVLADTDQAVCPLISTMDSGDFGMLFSRNPKAIRLQRSYRSTANINRFAMGLLGRWDPDAYIDRPGKEPVCIKTADLGREVGKTIDMIPRNMSVAVLTCDGESVWMVKKALGECLKGSDRPIQYLTVPDGELEEKIVVMPVILAKGLEFDAVIIWDDKNPEFWERSRNLKYLMCTRALHELYILTEDRQSS